jgi:hypothetical protein
MFQVLVRPSELARSLGSTIATTGPACSPVLRSVPAIVSQDVAQKGWFKQAVNGKRLKQDRAFDALRDRADFLMLLKRLGG